MTKKLIPAEVTVWFLNVSVVLPPPVAKPEVKAPPKAPEAPPAFDPHGIEADLNRSLWNTDETGTVPIGNDCQAFRNTPPAAPQKVFVIHGRDRAARESVARFVERVGFSAIVLAEQPDGGATVIEKLEAWAEVDFAVAIMTGDDPGNRARQNVVFELGYFAARIGRKRLAVLCEPGVEIPSDMAGMICIPLDEAGAWKFRLAREFGKANLRFDLNRALY